VYARIRSHNTQCIRLAWIKRNAGLFVFSCIALVFRGKEKNWTNLEFVPDFYCEIDVLHGLTLLLQGIGGGVIAFIGKAAGKHLPDFEPGQAVCTHNVEISVIVSVRLCSSYRPLSALSSLHTTA
jgi:hypothetical protein